MVEVIQAEIDSICERLLRKVHNGQFAMGGGTISSDPATPPTMWGGEKIMVYANPDGLAAAELISRLAHTPDPERLRAEVVELRQALAAVRDDILHERNRRSIICTVWHSGIETTVDFIDAALAPPPRADGAL